MRLTRTLLLALIGPAAALAVTWYAGLIIANTSAGKAPAAQIVNHLRTVPDDERLHELATLGVLYPTFDRLPAAEVLSMADRMFAGGYTPKDADAVIRVPFEPAPYLSGTSSWHLEIQSFWTPALLARAYELSNDPKYIAAAAQYIIDWGRYESSLWVPRGYFFNDHALAARAIILSEVWRLYRGSKAYQPQVAATYLGYASRLADLLLEDRLYEYRSNHGVMQCLALMHLATAFPLLEGFDLLFDTGWRRLQLQLGSFVDAEGVILEHSPGYHVDGVKMLGAAWRLLGMNGRPVPALFIERYRKAVKFSAALRRPDDSLPPIGDTHDTSYFPLPVAQFDSAGAVSTPLREITGAELQPEPVTLAAGAGYAVLWNDSAQTVFNWGNFATQIHKHADELGLSIWAGGVQWVRPVGYWPYVSSRREAIGWRSANTPHWLGESAAPDRSSSLLAHASGNGLSLFDVVRRNVDGSSIRRQVIQVDPGMWIVVDNFDSPRTAPVEILWRFSPELAVQSPAPGRLELSSRGHRMNLLVPDATRLLIDTDTDGTRQWNAGLVSGGKIVPSPAMRIQTDGAHRPVVSIFSLQDAEGNAAAPASATLHWKGPTDWSVELGDAQQNIITLERAANRISAGGANAVRTELQLTEAATQTAADAMNQALDAYSEARERYGIPFEVRLERRLKVTAAVAGLAVLQLAIFVWVALRRRRWWIPLLVTSSAAWLALCLFLHLRFLAMD